MVNTERCSFFTTVYGALSLGMTTGERLLSPGLQDHIYKLVEDEGYVKATAKVNSHFHMDGRFAFCASTIHDMVERRGTQAQGAMDADAELILASHGFEADPTRQEDYPKVPEELKTGKARSPLSVNGVELDHDNLMSIKVQEAIDAYNAMPRNDGQYGIRLGPADRLKCVESIFQPAPACRIDGVLTAAQKEGRDTTGKKALKPHGRGRKVESWVAHIFNDGKTYLIAAETLAQLMKLVLAFYIKNDLLYSQELVFFTDGETSIADNIRRTFAFRTVAVKIYLDYFHGAKKCRELGSMAFSGRSDKKEVIYNEINRRLWVGNVDGIIEYLDSIPEDRIKNAGKLKELRGYYLRKKEMITCYALRRQLGLRISSNDVEKAGDLLISHRQKGLGMSWSHRGSLALATMTAIRRNGELEEWIMKGTLSFRFRSGEEVETALHAA